MSHYGQQQQGYSGQYNNAGYDNSGTYPPQQQQDPNYVNGTAPPYSAYPAGGMGPNNNGYPSSGGGYTGSPGFNPSVANANNNYNNNLNHSSSHNSTYSNGPMNGGYDASSSSNNDYGQQYQSGALTYQQSIYNAPSHHQQQNLNQSQNQTYSHGQQQSGMSPATNNTPAPVPNRAQAPQPEGDYPVVMAIDFGNCANSYRPWQCFYFFFFFFYIVLLLSERFKHPSIHSHVGLLWSVRLELEVG